MADRLMFIPNDDTQNNTVCRLHLVVETFRHSNSRKVPKVAKPRKRKPYYNTLGTSVINSPMSPPSLVKNITLQFTIVIHSKVQADNGNIPTL